MIARRHYICIAQKGQENLPEAVQIKESLLKNSVKDYNKKITHRKGVWHIDGSRDGGTYWCHDVLPEGGAELTLTESRMINHEQELKR